MSAPVLGNSFAKAALCVLVLASTQVGTASAGPFRRKPKEPTLAYTRFYLELVSIEDLLDKYLEAQGRLSVYFGLNSPSRGSEGAAFPDSPKYAREVYRVRLGRDLLRQEIVSRFQRRLPVEVKVDRYEMLFATVEIAPRQLIVPLLQEIRKELPVSVAPVGWQDSTEWDWARKLDRILETSPPPEEMALLWMRAASGDRAEILRLAEAMGLKRMGPLSNQEWIGLLEAPVSVEARVKTKRDWQVKLARLREFLTTRRPWELIPGR